jgi:hypothetical protein
MASSISIAQSPVFHQGPRFYRFSSKLSSTVLAHDAIYQRKAQAFHQCVFIKNGRIL